MRGFAKCALVAIAIVVGALVPAFGQTPPEGGRVCASGARVNPRITPLSLPKLWGGRLMEEASNNSTKIRVRTVALLWTPMSGVESGMRDSRASWLIMGRRAHDAKLRRKPS